MQVSGYLVAELCRYFIKDASVAVGVLEDPSSVAGVQMPEINHGIKAGRGLTQLDDLVERTELIYFTHRFGADDYVIKTVLIKATLCEKKSFLCI